MKRIFITHHASDFVVVSVLGTGWRPAVSTETIIHERAMAFADKHRPPYSWRERVYRRIHNAHHSQGRPVRVLPPYWAIY